MNRQVFFKVFLTIYLCLFNNKGFFFVFFVVVFFLCSEPYHDIRYNLMAVVADGMTICEEKLKTLSIERYSVIVVFIKIAYSEMTCFSSYHISIKTHFK